MAVPRPKTGGGLIHADSMTTAAERRNGSCRYCYNCTPSWHVQCSAYITLLRVAVQTANLNPHKHAPNALTVAD